MEYFTKGITQSAGEAMTTPLVFRATDIETGITISKAYRGPYVFITQESPVTLGFDFKKLLNLMRKIQIAERKEKNKRVLSGIKE